MFGAQLLGWRGSWANLVGWHWLNAVGYEERTMPVADPLISSFPKYRL